MPINRDDIKLIDRFIDGALSEDDATKFAEKQNDPEFSAELELRQEVAQAIYSVSRENLKRDLKSKLGNIDLNERPRHRILFYAVAACLVLLLVVLWFFPGKPMTESLFHSYYIPYPASIHTRGSVDEAMVIKSYEEGRYEEASRQITEVLAIANPDSKDHLLLLLGNCYLNVNDISRAEKIFKDLQKRHDNIIKEQAQWFLSLTYLKSGQIESCRKLLKELETSKGFHASFAKELLNQLDQF